MHDGPRRASRLDLNSIYANYLTLGLYVTDFVLTENSILIAGTAILAYLNMVFDEPPIKGLFFLSRRILHSS